MAALVKETILGAQASSHLGAYVGVARIKWRSYLAQMPKLPSFLENFQQNFASNLDLGGKHDPFIMAKLPIYFHWMVATENDKR